MRASRRLFLASAFLVCLDLITTASAQKKVGVSVPGVVPVRDVRVEIAEETARFKAKHPIETYIAPKHSRTEIPWMMRSAEDGPTPGGVGYGYWFTGSELHWEDSTVLDMLVVTPSTVGGNMDYFLYLTSTNRSNLGVEAFISYYNQNEAQFKVYDWARDDHWQTSINLPTSNPQYLTTRPDEFGHPRQMCRIRNATIYLGPGGAGYRWRNEALLFNFTLGVWDLLYSYEYSTVAKEENTYQTGEHMGSWAPIVEIWTDEGDYDNLNRIGFDLTRLFQDGSPTSYWLLPSNSWKSQMSFFNVITRPLNRGFVVYTGPTDPDGDGYDNAEEAEAGTNPNQASSFFCVTDMAQYPSTNEVGVTVESVLGRLYRLYEKPSIGGAWSLVGSPTHGTGAPLELRGSLGFLERFHRVRVEYDMGALCVTTNTDEASFTLNPAGGTVPPDWSQMPNGDRWDKSVVGVPVGTYLLSFEPVTGMTTPADQWVTITRGDITHAEGIYTPE